MMAALRIRCRGPGLRGNLRTAGGGRCVIAPRSPGGVSPAQEARVLHQPGWEISAAAGWRACPNWCLPPCGSPQPLLPRGQIASKLRCKIAQKNRAPWGFLRSMGFRGGSSGFLYRGRKGYRPVFSTSVRPPRVGSRGVVSGHGSSSGYRIG
jgi:hypothetical protein